MRKRARVSLLLPVNLLPVPQGAQSTVQQRMAGTEHLGAGGTAPPGPVKTAEFYHFGLREVQRVIVYIVCKQRFNSQKSPKVLS